MIKVKTRDFRNALESLLGIIEKRNTIPALATVLLEPTEGNLRLKATDLDIEVVAEIPSCGAGLNTACIFEPDILHHLVKVAGHNEIEISDGVKVRIANDVETRLAFLPSEDYPYRFKGDETESASAKISNLDSWKTIAHAICQNETRYYLNGIYVHADGANYKSVATDGHRLNIHDFELSGASGTIPSFILPAKTVSILTKHFNGPMTMTVLGPSASYVRFSGTKDGVSFTVTSRTIDGTYPDYKRVFPQAIERTATIQSAAFRRAISAFNINKAHDKRAVKISFNGEWAKIESSTRNDAHIGIDFPYTGNSNNIISGFNSAYLHQVACMFVDAREISIGFGAETIEQGHWSGPVKFSSADRPEVSAYLMPMRV